MTNPVQAIPFNVDVSVGDTEDAYLYERAQRAFNVVQMWQGMWQRVMEHIAPSDNNYYNAPGTRKQQTIYDNTGTYYVNTYLAQSISSIFPPQSVWGTLFPSHGMIHSYMRRNQMSLDDEDARKSARDTLQRGCCRLNAQAFDLLMDSNFDSVLPSALVQRLLTAAPFHISKDTYRGHGVRFYIPPLGSWAIDQDGFGNHMGTYHSTLMTVNNAQLQWPDMVIPAGVDGKVQSTFIDCCVREENTSGAKKTKRWKNVILMVNASPTNGQKMGAVVVRKPIYTDTNPWVIMGTQAARSEVYGRGRAIEVFQDLERINNETYNRIVSQNMAAHPMIMVKNDGSINPATFRTGPGAIVAVKSTGGPSGASLVPFELPYNHMAMQSVREETDTNVRRMMLGDPQLSAGNNTYMTAHEWADRQRRNQLLWGKDYGKILPAARSILMRVIEVGLRSGEIEWPSELAEFKGAVDLDYFGIKLESPVSKMYNSQEVESLISITQVAQSLSPQLLDLTMRVSEIPRYLSVALGVNPELFKSNEEIAQTAEAAEQMAAQSSPDSTVMPFNPAGM